MTVMLDQAPGVVVQPEQIAAWLGCAKAGDEFVYATRCGLPAASEGAKAVRDASTLGLVQLYQRPIAGKKERNYVARRTGRPVPAEAGGKRAPARIDVRHVDDEARTINELMGILGRAARFQRPCPTDFALARRARVDRREIARVMELLEVMNLIRVRRVPAPTLRQVTIVATGHRTGMVG